MKKLSMMRILGVDPGSRWTGFGCIEVTVPHQSVTSLVHGTLHLIQSEKLSLEDRLLKIYEGLSQLIRDYQPQVLVVEKVFFAKNALSSLKLGQARGAVLLTGKIHALEIFEYSSTEVKKAVTGYGRADKEQVAKMIGLLIGQRFFETMDASDALALAICHAMQMQWKKRLLVR